MCSGRAHKEATMYSKVNIHTHTCTTSYAAYLWVSHTRLNMSTNILHASCQITSSLSCTHTHTYTSSLLFTHSLSLSLSHTHTHNTHTLFLSLAFSLFLSFIYLACILRGLDFYTLLMCVYFPGSLWEATGYDIPF